MPDRVACTPWVPSECEGTDGCPPRCPRVVLDGHPVLIVEHDQFPSSAVPGELTPPDRVPDDLLLIAELERTAVGYVHVRPVDDNVRLATIDVAWKGAAETLRTELARQALAYAGWEGAERVVLDDPVAVTAYREIGFEETGDDGRLGISLSDPGVAAVTTAPPSLPGDREASRVDDGDSSTQAAISSLSRPEVGLEVSSLFEPDGVAVVGATDREGSIGRQVMENLDDYPGAVVPVTPRADGVLGRPAPSSIRDVEEAVDLAVVLLPAEAAVDAVAAAGECGIATAIVVAAGFGETDGGEDRARRLRAVARDYDMTLVGPNSMGVMSTASGLNASFSPRHPPRGAVSLVSQSGAFITAAIDAGIDRGIGFRNVVSVGNAAILDETDLLQYLDRDPGTAVIAAYLEGIGDGKAFVERVSEVTRSTPVVVLKAGRTRAGARAAASHTGALVGRDDAVDAAFDRAGVVSVDSATELLDVAGVLRESVPTSDGVAVVTNAGGPGVLTADAVDEAGLSLAPLEDATRNRLEEALPSAASVENPVDVLGDANENRFTVAIDAVLGDPGVDFGVVVTTPHPLIDYADLIAAVGRRSAARDTPVVLCPIGGDLDADARRSLTRYGVTVHDDPSRAVRAVAAVREYADACDRPPVTRPEVDLDRGRISEILDTARQNDRDHLGVESLSLLEVCGIPVPEWEVAETPEEAADLAATIGTDVALKVASPDIAHKTDVSGVQVGVPPAETLEVCETMLADVRDAVPDAGVDGVVVQECVGAGTELIVGTSDSRFGPLVTVGLGGVFVEHLDDLATALAPVDRRRAQGMLDSLDASAVLDGARDRQAVDRGTVVDGIVRLSAIAAEFPAIESIEVNPLVATANGAMALDLQVALQGTDGDTSGRSTSGYE